MPLTLYEKKRDPDLKIWIWNIQETEAFFVKRLFLSTEEMLSIYQNYPHQLSRRHWLGSRYLLLSTLGEEYKNLSKDAYGKFILKDSLEQICISHSGERVTVLSTKLKSGIDIQEIQDKLFRIKDRFLTKKQEEKLKQSPDFKAYLHVHWGVKEALYKAHGLGGINLKEHLYLDDFSYEKKGGTFKAWFKKDAIQETYQATYQELDGYMLTYVTKC